MKALSNESEYNPPIRSGMTVWILIAISFLYFLTRGYNISGLPVYFDEAIYLKWSQLIRDGVTGLFLSKMDGKPPLFFWLTSLTMKAVDPPVLAGRVVSLFTGWLSMLGLYCIGTRLVSRQVGVIAMVLYLVSPICAFHDRIALVDGLVNLFAIFLIHAFLLLEGSEGKGIFQVIYLGLALGLGFMAKQTILLVFFLPLLFLLIRKRNLNLRTFCLVGVSYLIGVVLTLPYFFSGESITKTNPTLGGENLLFHTKGYLSGWTEIPLNQWMENVSTAFSAFQFYMGNVLLVFLIFSSVLIFLREKKYRTVLLPWFFLPILILIITANYLPSRYLFLAFSPALIICSVGIVSTFDWLRRKSFPFKKGQYTFYLRFIGIVGIIPIHCNDERYGGSTSPGKDAF